MMEQPFRTLSSLFLVACIASAALATTSLAGEPHVRLFDTELFNLLLIQGLALASGFAIFGHGVKLLEALSIQAAAVPASSPRRNVLRADGGWIVDSIPLLLQGLVFCATFFFPQALFEPTRPSAVSEYRSLAYFYALIPALIFVLSLSFGRRRAHSTGSSSKEQHRP